MAEDLNIYITTFNCGRELLDVKYFAANLFHDFRGDLPPDLIVLSLQEIAPIGYSFLGGSLLAPYLTRFTQAVFDGAGLKFGSTVEYASVLARNSGMTGIMVFARHGIEERIRSIRTGAVGVGWWDMGNKGAVGVRLGMEMGGYGREETLLTFVAAHLAPGEEKWERRNQDWKSICEGLVFERSAKKAAIVGGEQETEPLLSAQSQNGDDEDIADGGLFSTSSHLFFAGDLNYRISDTAPQPGSHDNWPQPVASTSDPRHYSNHLAKDQLTRELKRNKTLHLLAEAPIAFPPTYKFSSEASRQASHAVESTTKQLADGRSVAVTSYKTANADTEGHEWLWATHRFPSWCDRVLYLAAAKPAVHSYAALPVQPTSDHRPVALSFSIPAAPLKTETTASEAPFDVQAGWRERRAAARRYEVAVGLASYLGLTWEGEALVAGTVVGLVGGYFALSVLIAWSA